MVTDVQGLPWQLRGHEDARSLLLGLPARALLISGPEGVGRLQLARWYSATLNCLDAGAGPCGSCRSCIQWQGGHPDHLEIAPQLVTGTGRLNRRPEIRISQLVERQGQDDEPLSTWLERRPLFRWRVGVIDSAHLLTVAAANSFLKMLEEPPSWAKLILIAPDRLSLLPTIASRVTALRLKTVDTSAWEPADHPAHLLGTPGPLLRAAAEPDRWRDTAAAVDAFLSALSGPLGEAFEAAAALEKLWLSPDGADVPQLLRAGFRSLSPEARVSAEDALSHCEELLAAFVSPAVVLQLLTLELRAAAGNG